jgi:hypothetical protein
VSPLTPSPNQEAWTEFMDTKCHVCGATKPHRTGFCKACYFALPKEMQSALWKRFGSGFEDAYHEAKEHLIQERRARS